MFFPLQARSLLILLDGVVKPTEGLVAKAQTVVGPCIALVQLDGCIGLGDGLFKTLGIIINERKPVGLQRFAGVFASKLIELGTRLFSFAKAIVNHGPYAPVK